MKALRSSTLSRRSILCGPLSCLAGRSAAPQSATFSAEVNVVNILATVRDKNGQLVEDLTKDDVNLFEDGHRQVIRYFSSKSELPLTIALMVDTSLSQQRLLTAEGRTVAQFMKHVLRRGTDRSMIVRFDQDIRILQNFSTEVDTDALLDNINDAEMRAGGGTHLYGAVYSICRQKLSSQRGRKAMIILSDGLDYGSRANIADAEGMAIKNDVVIYTVLFFDSSSYGEFSGSSAKGAAVLKSMSAVTGGAYFEPSKKLAIEQIFNLLADDLRGQYSIGYVSDRPVTKSEVRKLNLTANRPRLVVQARKWYFVEKPQS